MKIRNAALFVALAVPSLFAQDKEPECQKLPALHVQVTGADGSKWFDDTIAEGAKELNINFPQVRISICSEKKR